VKKDRIVYLDLMRAFAVLMMVQGHTVDSLLAVEFRTETSFFYSMWHLMRGFTAPIFMFTAGVVFTYLLLLGENNNINKTRFDKGFKRFLLLVGLGYLLRYPTYTLINFENISPLQWKIFFAVDTLHLIGFGLLFILLLALAAEKLNINKSIMFSLGAVFFFGIAPFFEEIDFSSTLHPFISGYLNNKQGSLFPLFPWAGYVLWGSVLGSILAKKANLFVKQNFTFTLISIGFLFMLVHLLYLAFDNQLPYGYYLSFYSILFFRTGFVLFLSGVMALVSKNIDTIPQIIRTIGKHTLSIYVVHIIILYGSAWSPGLSWLIGKNFSPNQVILAAIIMIITMISMANYIEKIKFKNLVENKLKPLVQSFLVK